MIFLRGKGNIFYFAMPMKKVAAALKCKHR